MYSTARQNDSTLLSRRSNRVGPNRHGHEVFRYHPNRALQPLGRRTVGGPDLVHPERASEAEFQSARQTARMGADRLPGYVRTGAGSAASDPDRITGTRTQCDKGRQPADSRICGTQISRNPGSTQNFCTGRKRATSTCRAATCFGWKPSRWFKMPTSTGAENVTRTTIRLNGSTR